MSGLVIWAALTLLLAGAFVVFLLWAIPLIIIGLLMLMFRRRMKAEGKPWSNQFRMGGPAKSGGDRVVRTSPDMIYMIGVYDVRAEPLVIHCAVPARDMYWCISLYRPNTDNFFVRNDRASREREFELVLAGPRADYRPVGNEEVVRARSSLGVVVIRAVVADTEDEEEIARVRATLQQTSMTPLSQWNVLSRQQAGTV